jgi:hypothetical protein
MNLAKHEVTLPNRPHGGTVVEALRYKLQVRGIDSQWRHCIFSLTKSFQPHYGPGVDSAWNRNEYQEPKGGQCVGLTTLLPSSADCLNTLWTGIFSSIFIINH